MATETIVISNIEPNSVDVKFDATSGVGVQYVIYYAAYSDFRSANTNTIGPVDYPTGATTLSMLNANSVTYVKVEAVVGTHVIKTYPPVVARTGPPADPTPAYMPATGQYTHVLPVNSMSVGGTPIQSGNPETNARLNKLQPGPQPWVSMVYMRDNEYLVVRRSDQESQQFRTTFYIATIVDINPATPGDGQRTTHYTVLNVNDNTKMALNMIMQTFNPFMQALDTSTVLMMGGQQYINTWGRLYAEPEDALTGLGCDKHYVLSVIRDASGAPTGLLEIDFMWQLSESTDIRNVLTKTKPIPFDSDVATLFSGKDAQIQGGLFNSSDSMYGNMPYAPSSAKSSTVGTYRPFSCGKVDVPTQRTASLVRNSNRSIKRSDGSIGIDPNYYLIYPSVQNDNTMCVFKISLVKDIRLVDSDKSYVFVDCGLVSITDNVYKTLVANRYFITFPLTWGKLCVMTFPRTLDINSNPASNVQVTPDKLSKTGTTWSYDLTKATTAVLQFTAPTIDWRPSFTPTSSNKGNFSKAVGLYTQPEIGVFTTVNADVPIPVSNGAGVPSAPGFIQNASYSFSNVDQWASVSSTGVLDNFDTRAYSVVILPLAAATPVFFIPVVNSDPNFTLSKYLGYPDNMRDVNVGTSVNVFTSVIPPCRFMTDGVLSSSNVMVFKYDDEVKTGGWLSLTGDISKSDAYLYINPSAHSPVINTKIYKSNTQTSPTSVSVEIEILGSIFSYLWYESSGVYTQNFSTDLEGWGFGSSTAANDPPPAPLTISDSRLVMIRANVETFDYQGVRDGKTIVTGLRGAPPQSTTASDLNQPPPPFTKHQEEIIIIVGVVILVVILVLVAVIFVRSHKSTPGAMSVYGGAGGP